MTNEKLLQEIALLADALHSLVRHAQAGGIPGYSKERILLTISQLAARADAVVEQASA